VNGNLNNGSLLSMVSSGIDVGWAARSDKHNTRRPILSVVSGILSVCLAECGYPEVEIRLSQAPPSYNLLGGRDVDRAA
jgi:hypothetical protein